MQRANAVKPKAAGRNNSVRMRAPRRRVALSLLVVAILTAVAPSIADAQRRRRNRPAAGEDAAPVLTLSDLDSILPKLQSANPDEVREAIDLLSVIDQPEVIPHLSSLLRSGRSDAITDRALDALGGLGHPTSIEILTAFTHHRRVGARRRAYQALAPIHDPRVPPLLETGLSDSDRSIRSVAALALGDMGATGSLEVLFHAFERGVVEAAIAIGKLGNRQSVEQFTQYLGQQPLAIMLSGYNEFLRRDDIPAQVKTDIVARLGEVAGPMVKRFLQDYLNTFSERDRSALRRQVEQTVSRIPDAPTGTSSSGGAQ